MPELSSQVAVKPEPGLRRVLTLWDLVFYGIVLIQSIAPVPLYGVAQKISAPFWLSWELTLRLFGNSRWLQIPNTSVAC